MAFDSQSTKPPSSITGTVPLGFISRYHGAPTLPYGFAPVETWPSGPIVPLASVNSKLTPASTQAQSTRCVQIEFGRPQILIMSLPGRSRAIPARIRHCAAPLVGGAGRPPLTGRSAASRRTCGATVRG